MTVTASNSLPVQVPGNGSATIFAAPFKIFSATDLVVGFFINGTYVLQSAGFTVSDIDSDGGCTCTFAVAPPLGTTVDLRTEVPIVQDTNFANYSSYLPESTTDTCDRIVRSVQDLARQTYYFGIHAGDNESIAWPTLPVPSVRAGGILSFDSSGLPQIGIPSTQLITTSLLVGFLAYFQLSPAEGSAGVTPVNFGYPVGDVRRYGPALDGIADDTIPLQNWAKVGGQLTFPVPEAALISAPIVFSGNTTITCCEGAQIICDTPNMHLFTAAGASNIILDGMHFKQTATGASPYVAHVFFDRCTRFVVQNCEFEGMQFYGIWAPGATYSTIRANYFHDALDTSPVAEGSADIDLSSSTTPSRYNVIDGNVCWGGLELGIGVWDPYSGIVPSHNIVCNNRVGGGQTGYGILLYFPTAADSFNQVIGNSVQDVKGSIAANPSSGAGIYVVGIGAGGTLVQGNTCVNCCINTGNSSLAPGGIGINGTAALEAPIIVSGNVVRGMTKYNGIIVTSCRGGVTVSGNSVTQPASNITGDCVQVRNSDNVTVVANTLVNANTTTASPLCVSVWADGAGSSDIVIANNTMIGGFDAQIRTIQTGGNLTTGINIIGNMMNGGGSSCTPLKFDSASCANVLVQGNQIRANTQPAVTQTAIASVRYTGNFLLSSGAITINFAGANTTGYFDQSNTGLTNDASVNNAGTGMLVERLGTGSPSAGTWAVGDSIRNRAPSAAGVFQWICTVAGTGGGTATFKTISNT